MGKQHSVRSGHQQTGFYDAEIESGGGPSNLQSLYPDARWYAHSQTPRLGPEAEGNGWACKSRSWLS